MFVYQIDGRCQPPLTADARCNMVDGMNHLTSMMYNDENRLEVVVDMSGDITSYYQYDGGGQRVRKTVINTASHTAKMRKYFLQWEQYGEYDTGTSIVSLERERPSKNICFT